MNTTTTIKTRLALAAALACLSAGNGWAQQQAMTAAPEQLQPVLVTGNPLRDKESTQPSLQLSGDALTLRRAATLGESLDGLPGVAATYFGPNANRPVLRGLDGDRVRLLSNSGASIDASSLSYDHAVPVNPLVVDRIEVLRGASALLYGGSAVGGVVNTLDKRIPRAAARGLCGAAELRLGGAANERNGALTLDGGNQAWAWHADLSGRKADDQRVPGGRVRNSASDSHGGAIGASALFSQGYAGVSLEDYRNDYGVTVEPDVTIKMQRQRLATAGEWRDAGGPLPRIQWQASRSIYEHKEVEGSGEVGTLFRSRGNDLRVEAEHAPIGLSHGDLRGVVGLQWERSDFSALGEEALVPATRSRSGALFLLEQYRSGRLSLSAGARKESVRIDSSGDLPGAEEPRFGAAEGRRFAPRSLSLSGGYQLSPAWSLQANLSDTQRAPMFYELYANGVHVATGAYERGDPALGLERARGVDLGLRWQGADRRLLRLNVYQTRFRNYIALDATGASFENEEGESLPEYRYRGVPARLSGLEIEARTGLPQMDWAGPWRFTLGGQFDVVRGSNRATGEALPRLAPQRATLSLTADDGGLWSASLELRLAARQDRVPALDKPTPGYGLVRVGLARQLKLGGHDALWYLKLDNLGNTKAYSATSMATLRDLAPLPGRSALMGLQLRF
ncbi:TonB-dependent receptor [Roseateles sp. DAIF2]|uniref:TonB-dependent receptor n=1 Tax=Roseateles sp. DAIF2 TaxID=2714952 RepID=UPI0018A2F822|nr:TonB-dependent receptor [Roseateles sp. DAIF2]QPF73862.1 TonB-dependent receptor [Roseateles sp. DAIF2]